MAVKDINDPAFFENANLEALAEGIEVPDPDGDAGGEGDDASVEVDAGDAESVADESADAVDSSENGDVVEDEKGDDPAPHLDDLDTAKVAYAELRKFANKRDMEAQKLAERIAALESENQALTEFDYGDEPSYDARAFTQMAGEDPRAAFAYALQGGQTSDAQAAIAKVQADAAEVAALSAMAHRDGDQQAYGQLNAQAVNLHALAQSMSGELSQAQYAQQQAPLVAAERNRNLQQAEQAIAQQHPDYAARRAQVIQVLREQPNLISGHDAQAIHRGLTTAYAVAAMQPAPIADVATTIDDQVKQAVEKHIAATRAAKAKAADAATGASGERAGPAASSAQPSQKDAIYADQAARSLGARAFMDM